MSDQERGSNSDFNLEGARDRLEQKGSGYKEQFKKTAEDLSRKEGRDFDEQKASRSDRDISRGDREEISPEDRETSDPGLDRDEGEMKSSQGRQGDPLFERNRREMDQFLDPSDS